MNLLIIEDEPPILREIVSTIEDLHSGYTVIDTALNGSDALEKIKKYNHDIDIIITDINLPVFSGLDIIQFTKTNYPDIICIILSGYDDFSYVQKALQLSVLDYLLKPIDAVEMKQVLQNAWERKCVRRFSPTVISRKQSITSNTYYLAIICVDSYVYDEKSIDDDIQTSSYFSSHFQHILDLTLTDNNFWLIDGSFCREKFLMVSLNTQLSVKNVMETLYPKFTVPNHSVTMIVNTEPIDIVNINATCQKLRKQMKKAIVIEKSQLLFSPVKAYPFDSAYYENEINGLGLLFTANDFTYFLTKLKEFISHCKKNALPQYYVMQLIHSLLTNCKGTTLKENMDWQQSLTSDIFLYSFTYEVLYRDIKSVLELRFEENNLDSTENKDVLAVKLDHYIQLHFREPINTQSLCTIFNFTPAYISKLYKDYKGISPTSYITQLRMEEAQKLLTESNMNIRDLSVYLGYDDPFYFSKLFKKLYGLSPKQYQKIKNL